MEKPRKEVRMLNYGLWAITWVTVKQWTSGDNSASFKTWLFSYCTHKHATGKLQKGIRTIIGFYSQLSILGLNITWPCKAPYSKTK